MTPQNINVNTAVLSRLEEKIDTISIKVNDINTRLYGNGNPGIIVDQALQNKQIQDLMDTETKNGENIKLLLELTPNKWLGKNWVKIVMLATLFFVLLHSLMPEGVSIWQILQVIK